MLPDSDFAGPVGSFDPPILPPGVDPDASPGLTLTVACEWLPFIRGALFQLVLQSTWQGTPDQITLAQSRAMTLISMFGECGESVVPVACAYDFSTSESELGWRAWDGVCVAPTASFVGAGWSSGVVNQPGCAPIYQQLGVERTWNAHLTSVALNLTCVDDCLIQVVAFSNDTTPPSGTATLIGTTSVGPGANQVVTFAADLDVVCLAIILTNDPFDGSVNSEIVLNGVETTITSVGGLCP